jgi:hypothetical protein
MKFQKWQSWNNTRLQTTQHIWSLTLQCHHLPKAPLSQMILTSSSNISWSYHHLAPPKSVPLHKLLKYEDQACAKRLQKRNSRCQKFPCPKTNAIWHLLNLSTWYNFKRKPKQRKGRNPTNIFLVFGCSFLSYHP